MNEFEEKNINEAEVLDETANKQDGKIDIKKEIFEWVKAIAIALVVAFFLRNYVLTLAKVDGQSMEPSLKHADRLYVNKVRYTPKKGDVVIFEPSAAQGKAYIKRVIATEGDTIYIDFKTGDVFVNDSLIDEPYINEPTHLMGAYIRYLIETESYSKENPIKIEKGYFWAMGDNRNASKDSRELGPIPQKELIGHAVFRFWPLASMGTVDFDVEE